MGTARSKDKLGQCYLSAGRYMLDHGKSSETSLVLCHGTVTGTAGKARGVDYGHARLELWDAVVIDTESDKRVLKADYYRIGKVRDVKRYTYQQTLDKMLETGHYGPWE